MVTSDRTIKWVENLADQERLIKAGEKSSLDLCTTKEEVLSTETSSFVRNLYYHFEYLIRLFNARVDHSALQIKLQRQGENFDAFSASRNGVRLRVSGNQPGSVQLQCERTEALEGALRGAVQFSGLIEARFEPFHEVQWYFLDAVIGSEQVARHYLTEFLQVSRSPKLN